MAQLLARLDVPGNRVEALVATPASSMAATSRRPVTAPAVQSGQVSAAVGDAPVSSHALSGTDWAVGRTLGLVNLRASSGATVLAIRRGSTHAPPPIDWLFADGDLLYMVGEAASIRRARLQLTSGPQAADAERLVKES
ncbi:MAG: TrkA C-terminal domain-containing protein [Vicinamibacterales bacterium]